MASPPKAILDPVHGIIEFEDSPTDQLLLRLINCREFQRLRRICQLGMTPLVFPGANHTRFAHSLGVLHNAKRFLSRLELVSENRLSTEQKRVVLIAALLHDVGHGPFSHAFEQVTQEDHEARSREIILDDSTEINQCLLDFDKELPAQIPMFLDADVDSSENTTGIPAYLTQIVSSQLDADRFDYLIRDSHATGAEYGRFDFNWILNNLFVDEDQERLVLGHKALNAAESYIFARYHMYRSVYFHKTTRAAEVMLKELFERFHAMLNDCDSEQARMVVVPNAPLNLVKGFSGDALSLQEYLSLDDHTMTEFFKACLTCNDGSLKQLSIGLLNRKLYKAVDMTHYDHSPGNIKKFRDQAAQLLEKEGFKLGSDTPGDTPYKPYQPDVETPATQIYLDMPGVGVRELGAVSDLVKVLKTKYSLIRYYFPEQFRDRMVKLKANIFG